MLSGIQPTGVPHLGNYLGAIRNWSQLQNEFDYYLFIADLHSLTVPQDAQHLEDSVYKLVAYLLACGIDPKTSTTLFLQSHVPQHLQLAWILNCMSYIGELSRMTQFKDKSKKSEENLNAGLFTYPVLQAADILLYKPHYVPVGEDQRQHIELTRNLAERFNKRYKKNIFIVPEPFIKEEGGRVMDFQDPSSKMSKSGAFPNGIIFLNDSDDVILKKVKSAVTDSKQAVSPEDLSPGIKNLVQVLAILSAKTAQAVLEENSGKLYGHFKIQVAEQIIATVRPIREKAESLLKDRKDLMSLLAEGTRRAQDRAQKTLSEVYKATGLICPK
jgi:tryptophanyl-tRNA synthetase